MPRRKWGQHFLRDQRTARRIVDAIGLEPGERVLEIGPGTGQLTRELLPRAAALAAVEIDPELAAALPGRLGEPQHLTVLPGDAARLDLGALAARHLPPGAGALAVGNLPYESATAILARLLDATPPFRGIAVVVQHEVAERILARPGSRDYGYLSVLCQDVADPSRLLGLLPGAFRPPPRVHSALVRLCPRQEPRRGALERDAFRALVAGLFGQRRKTIANNLRAHRGLGRDEAEAALRAAGIPGSVRPEDLSPEEFAALLTELDRL